jgi:hypothetical protein
MSRLNVIGWSAKAVIEIAGLLQRVGTAKHREAGAMAAFVLTAGLAIYTAPLTYRSISPNPAPVESAKDAAREPVPAVVPVNTANSAAVMSPVAAIQSTVQNADVQAPAATDRTLLVRALQAELSRAQCYDGPVNSVWTVQSKEAMRRFTSAVNAQLPVGEPDQILLALIESNPGAKCQDVEVKTAAAATLAPPPQAMQDHFRAVPPPTISATPASPAPVATTEIPREASPSPGIERRWAPSDLAQAASPATVQVARVIPITVTPIQQDRQIKTEFKAEPRAPRPHVQPKAERRLTPFKPKPAPFAGVAKSVDKGIKSLQRSLASIFN